MRKPWVTGGSIHPELHGKKKRNRPTQCKHKAGDMGGIKSERRTGTENPQSAFFALRYSEM